MDRNLGATGRRGGLRLVVDNTGRRRVRTVPSVWPLAAWGFAWAFLAGGFVGWALLRSLYGGR